VGQGVLRQRGHLPPGRRQGTRRLQAGLVRDAAVDAHEPRRIHARVLDRLPNAHYTQQQVYKLLLANGIPKDVATNLAIISAKGEDASGDPRALNDNAKTGDYSVGLFQENFLGQMGVDRVRKFAPQFGKNPNMPVQAFVDVARRSPLGAGADRVPDLPVAGLRRLDDREGARDHRAAARRRCRVRSATCRTGRRTSARSRRTSRRSR
jgi:hypothetical protein